VTAAREAILRYFAEPPRRTPEDLGVVFTLSGRPVFVDAHDIVEITPPLAASRLPGGPSSVAFWRGKAFEVRGSAENARNFLLLRGAAGAHFVASDSVPRAVSRMESEDVPRYRREDGR